MRTWNLKSPFSPSPNFRVRLVICTLLCFVLGNRIFALPRYTITDIGFSASDINNKGQVSGSGLSSTTQGQTHAFRYTDGIGQEDLGVASHDWGFGPSPETSSTGNGINDLGQVVGKSGSWSFRYTDGVGMENLSDLYCTVEESPCTSTASEINSLGQVTGFWFSFKTSGAVRLTDGAAKIVYGVAFEGDDSSIGIDINNAGQVVGYSHSALDIRHAFRTTDGLGMEFLGSLGGSIDRAGGAYSYGASTSEALGINTAGQVTGKSSTSSGRWHGFLYTDSVGLQDLGVLPGDDSSAGIEINDDGYVVGESWNATGGFHHPVLWTRPGCPENLNLAPGIKESGWTLVEVKAINNQGQIVGNGKSPSGETRGFRLTPLGNTTVNTNCIASSATIDPTSPIGSGAASIEPAKWKQVKPIGSCTSVVCKKAFKLAHLVLKKRAATAIKTQKAANIAAEKLAKVGAGSRARAELNAAKKNKLAQVARQKFDLAVANVQKLHD